MSFREGTRGQSIQVGAVLIFGLVIVLFSSYQAFVVPSQNQGVEFNHHQDVERDMVDLRAAVLQAKTTGDDQYTTVQLGTEFPSRVIARNPPSPSGTLRTTENRTLRVDIAGDTQKLSDWFNGTIDENRFITYSPNYAEYREGGPIRYENTVVYKDFDDANVVVTDQRLLRNDTISLVPVHRQFQASGRQNVPVEPSPSAVQTEENVVDPNITVGTELKNETWVSILQSEIDAGVLEPSDINVTTLDGERVLQLNLTGEYDIEYSPVGLDREPFAPDVGKGEDASEINPAAPGDIRLANQSRNSNSASNVTLTFNNTANPNNFTHARIAFYQSAEGGNNVPEWANISEGPTPLGDNTQVFFTDGMKRLDSKIRLPGSSEVDVTLNFANANKENPNLSGDSWFVLEFLLETGEKVTYFVQIPDG